MVALWLVEGVRKGGKDYPSLNPFLCSETNPEKNLEWLAKNQEAALKAYQEWWKKAQSLPTEKAAAIDPLKGTNLRWY